MHGGQSFWARSAQDPLLSWSIRISTKDLTNRCSQPLAGVMPRFDFMKQFSMFATLAAASGGSALSR
jgi:hypothetical protein